MARCDQELCPMWDGHGCHCAVFELDRNALPADGVFTVETREDVEHEQDAERYEARREVYAKALLDAAGPTPLAVGFRDTLAEAVMAVADAEAMHRIAEIDSVVQTEWRQRAEKAEAEVERLHSWQGLLSLLDEHWPEETFPTLADDAERDTGPRLIAALRRVGEAVSRILAIDKIHVQLDDDGSIRCADDGWTWPCPTNRAIHQ